MSMTFTSARRESASVLVSLAGPSGGGKTMSALRLARGLAGDGKIAFADTEARRALHYAGLFEFDHLDLVAPFKPDRFLQAVEAAERGGYRVLIIDSASHEYDGEGGIIDWADSEEKKGIKSPGNWAAPKQAHKRMMQRLLQARLHLIFCLRADEKIKIEKVFDERRGREVTAVTPIGWQPICEKRFMYEMTASFLMLADRPGVPIPTKLQEQHKVFFPEGQTITEETGRGLAAWANGALSPVASVAKTAAVETSENDMKQIVHVVDQEGEVITSTSLWQEALASFVKLRNGSTDPTKVSVNNLDMLKAIQPHVSEKHRAKLAQTIEAAEYAKAASMDSGEDDADLGEPQQPALTGEAA